MQPKDKDWYKKAIAAADNTRVKGPDKKKSPEALRERAKIDRIETGLGTWGYPEEARAREDSARAIEAAHRASRQKMFGK